jgi:glycerol uptake facilitator-like aquaporin
MMKTPKTFLKDYWPNTTLVDDAKAAAIEFVGTTLFLLLAFGGTQGSHEAAAAQGSDLERALYIATAFGLSLLVSAWFFFRATGGLFNPDVSLALLLLGCIGPVRFVLYCIAQLAGAVAAAGIVLALTPGPLAYKCVSGAAPCSRPSFDISFPFPFFFFFFFFLIAVTFRNPWYDDFG